MNLLLLTDSYKLSHWKQYPPGTKKVYSYFESRGGKYPYTVFFGLQYFLKRYLVGCRVSIGDVEAATEFTDQHIGKGVFNTEGWMRIATKHMGALPVRIKAVPEGSIVPNHNVLMTIENTDPETPWLTNYLETLLVQTWYPTTVATQSRAIRLNILKFLNETGNPAEIDFKLQDFGFRGVSSPESAGIGGAAHLVNFKGSDTISGILSAAEYYGAKGMTGFSIPAAEHSTITSWGRTGEAAAYQNMLRAYPDGPIAVVSDSYNIFEACGELWGHELKQEVLNRNGVLIIRPDSGDLPQTLLTMLRILSERFGSTKNSKGYKVLHDKVRIIQGDGVNEDSINRILKALQFDGWSADNLAFGMGGALLQKLDRDTQKFAFKCSFVEGDYGQRDVFKSPVGDAGKTSKAGRLKLVREGEGYRTIQEGMRVLEPDLLQTVFENGTLLIDQNFADIRERAR